MKYRQCLIICVSANVASGAIAADTATPAGFDAKAREIYAQVISMPTQAGDHAVPAMAEYLAKEFLAAGFPAADVTILPLKSAGDETASLVVRYRGNGKGDKPILMIGHMDVVTAKREDWERDPFKLVEEDGYFYGRGTCDNKEGVTALTATFLRLKAQGFVPRRDLILYFSGDEETRGETTRDVLKNHRKLIDAEFALNSDAGGGSLDNGTGKPLSYGLQSAEKTHANFTATARNPGGHSAAPRADNAIFDLAAALERLRPFRFPVMWNDTTIASLKAAGEVATGELGAALERFVANPQDVQAAEILAKDPNYLGQTRTTCVPTMLAGGHAKNALAQSASVNVNCRIFPGVSIEVVRKTLQEIMGTQVDVTVVGEPTGSDASPLRADVMDAVSRAVHSIHPGIPVVPMQSSGGTDGKRFRSIGIPTYGVDGNFTKSTDDFSHGLNERLSIRSFYDSLTFWYVLINELAGEPVGAAR